MSRILLADDSPHAQRMGERILREEGFEVVTVTDGETALVRLPDVDPDLVLADVFLPHKSGYEICEYIKNNARYRHVRVVLLAGLLEPVDDAEVRRVKADAVLKKPLEASAVIATAKRLAEAADADRKAAKTAAAPAAQPAPSGAGGPAAAPAPAKEPAPPRMFGSILGLSSPPVPKPAAKPPEPAKTAAEPRTGRMPERSEIDPELVRAAVTVALDRAMPALIEEIAGRVLEALRR
jgi:CheY-like chemotaxis protein